MTCIFCDKDLLTTKCYAKAINILLFIVLVCSVGVHTPLELKEMQERMKSSQLETYDFSDDVVVKDHLHAAW